MVAQSGVVIPVQPTWFIYLKVPNHHKETTTTTNDQQPYHNMDAEEEREETQFNHPDATEPFFPSPTPPKQVLIRLYISHWLSTWNSRMFEFGAVLFLASIFQGTLLYASVYALVRSLTAVVLSSWLGSVADRASRLKVVRQSIGMLLYLSDFTEYGYLVLTISDERIAVWQRVPVAASCGCFLLLTERAETPSPVVSHGLFVGVVLLACVEKLAAVVNAVAVERDWVCCVHSYLNWSRN